MVSDFFSFCWICRIPMHDNKSVCVFIITCALRVHFFRRYCSGCGGSSGDSDGEGDDDDDDNIGCDFSHATFPFFQNEEDKTLLHMTERSYNEKKLQ